MNGLAEAIYLIPNNDRAFTIELVPWVHAEWKRGDEQMASHRRLHAPVCLPQLFLASEF